MRRSQTTNVGRVLFCLPRMLLTINGQLIALHRGSSGPALTKKPVHRQRDRCSYQSHHHTNSRHMECGHSFRLQMKHFGYTGISNSCPGPTANPYPPCRNNIPLKLSQELFKSKHRQRQQHLLVNEATETHQPRPEVKSFQSVINTRGQSFCQWSSFFIYLSVK